MVNLEYYKHFYYVAKCGGITAAARKLNLSQPAVTQSIHQLESALGSNLFRRTAKGMDLTKEGELLYRYVSRGYEQIETGEQMLSRLQHLDAGEVRIGASDMTLQFFLLPYLEKFNELYPQVKVAVTNAPTPETLSHLENDKIDFGIVSTPFDCPDSLSVNKVREIQDVFVAGRKFIQYKNRMLDFQHLNNLPLIMLEGNTSTRKYVETFIRESGCEIKPEFELATSDMIVQFALKNLGVGCVVRDFAKPYLDSGVLFELMFHYMIPKRHICVVYDKTRSQSRAAAKLLELIEES